MENLYTILPLGVILALWLTLADSFGVIASSAKLLGSVKSVSLILVYGCITTMAVTLGIVIVLSILVTLTDVRRKLSIEKHAGRVLSVFVFVGMFGIGVLLLGNRGAIFHPLDPRFAFPLLACGIAAWLIGRVAGGYCARTYQPGNWPELIGWHYSVTAGLAVFLFGSFMAQYNSLKEDIYISGYFSLEIENYLYYLIFIIVGLLTWWVLKKIFHRLASRSGGLVIGLMAVFIIFPLLIFLRPAPPNNPDKHNPNPGKTGRNVILISIDTLRYDGLGCNGNDYIKTPNIDAFAEEGIVFDNCIVSIPLTLPSHTSMLTGLYPRTHGLRVQDYFLDDGFTTLAEILSEEGYTCGGFISMAILRSMNSNLNQGFHYYDDYWIYENASRWFPPEVKYFFAGKVINKLFTGVAAHPDKYERKAEETVDSAIRWLDLVKDEDFFCFFHIFDPHWYYNAPEPYTTMYDPDYDESGLNYDRYLKDFIWTNDLQIDQDDIDHIKARYDGEATYSDAQLGRLFDSLKESGLWDETMIILTADHGESFGHDYFFGHADRVYQSCIHVPLIIKPFNGADGLRREMLVSNADFFPTICETLNINSVDDLDGESLLPALNDMVIEDFQPHPVIFSESYAFKNYNIQHYGKVYSIIKDGWKLIYSPFAFPYAPIYQYYDLTIDPAEEHNLYDIHPGDAKDLFTLLKKWVDEDEKPLHGIFGRIERENLETLQYLN